MTTAGSGSPTEDEGLRPLTSRRQRSRKQSSLRRPHYNERLKTTISQLESQIQDLSCRSEELVQANQTLRRRYEVSQQLVQCARQVDALYREGAAMSESKQQHLGAGWSFEEGLRSGILGSYEPLIQKLSHLVTEAAVQPPNSLAHQVLGAAVRSLAHFTITIVSSCSPATAAQVETAHYEKAIKALQVPEQEHWRRVRAALNLQPDQIERATIAKQLSDAALARISARAEQDKSRRSGEFSHHSGRAGRAAESVSEGAGSGASSSRGVCGSRVGSSAGGSVRSQLGLAVGGIKSKDTGMSSAASTSMGGPAAAAAAAGGGTPMGRAEAAVLAGLQEDFPGAAGGGLEGSSSGLLPAGGLSDVAQRLDAYLAGVRDWGFVLMLYVMLHVLTPMQAAGAYINSYPLYPSAQVIISNIGDEPAQP